MTEKLTTKQKNAVLYINLVLGIQKPDTMSTSQFIGQYLDKAKATGKKIYSTPFGYTTNKKMAMDMQYEYQKNLWK